MTRTKLLLTGLVAGTLALGTGCASHMANGTGGSGPKTDSEKSTTGIYDGYQVPQEDRASTGGSGYEDAVTNPAASGTSQGEEKKQDIRDADPMNEPGTGGSGYEQDSDMFKQHEELGGSRFPGDKAIPQ